MACPAQLVKVGAVERGGGAGRRQRSYLLQRLCADVARHGRWIRAPMNAQQNRQKQNEWEAKGLLGKKDEGLAYATRAVGDLLGRRRLVVADNGGTAARSQAACLLPVLVPRGRGSSAQSLQPVATAQTECAAGGWPGAKSRLVTGAPLQAAPGSGQASSERLRGKAAGLTRAPGAPLLAGRPQLHHHCISQSINQPTHPATQRCRRRPKSPIAPQSDSSVALTFPVKSRRAPPIRQDGRHVQPEPGHERPQLLLL